MPRPNVYITNRAGHDYEPARAFGDLIFLTEGIVNHFKTNRLYRTIKPIIEVSQQEDYILLAGLSTLSALACAMFAVRHDKLNLLIYDGKTHSYRPRHLDLSDLEEGKIEDLLQKVRED